VEQTNTPDFSDRLPALLYVIRGIGIADPSAELLQVFAALILLSELRVSEPGLGFGGVQHLYQAADPGARIPNLREVWSRFPTLTSHPSSVPERMPELLRASDSGASRVIRFLWEEVNRHSIQDPEGRRALLEDLEAVIEFWMRDSKYATAFGTPAVLSDLILSLARPTPGDRIYDPCCGIGTLLAGAAARVSRPQAAAEPERKPQSETRIAGMELDSRLYPVALARILLSGDIRPELRVGNTLAEPIRSEGPAGQFDCIVANLPFGVRQPQDVMWQYPIRTTSSESAFIQHILAHLRPGGRAVIVVPESFLFRRGADVELRRWLLEKFLVESVWSLPTGTFSASTSLKTSILVIRNSPPQQHVAFLGERLVKPLFESKTSSVSVGYGTGKSHVLATLWTALQGQTILGSAPLLASVSGITSVLGPASLAVLPAIYALNQWRKGRSLGSVEDQIEQIPIADLAHRHWELLPKKGGAEELQAFLAALQAHIGDVGVVKLGELAEVFSGVSYRSEQLIRNPATSNSSEVEPQNPAISPVTAVPFVRVQDVGAPKHGLRAGPSVRLPLVYLAAPHLKVREQQQLRIDDILLTRSGSVGNLGLIGESLVGAVPANGIIVIRTNGNYDALALLRLLQTVPYQDWIRGNASGSVIQHLPARAIKDVPIPLLNGEQQARLRALAEGVDAEVLLRTFADADDESPLVAFLLRNPDVQTVLATSGDEAYPAEWWSALRSALDGSPRMAGEEGYLELIQQGLSTWIQHGANLLEAMDLSAGLERYAALQTWTNSAIRELWPIRDRGNAESAQGSLESRISERIASLCQVVLEAAEVEANRIANSATIGVEVQALSVALNPAAELPIAVANRGLAPLRKITVAIPEFEGRAQFALLRAEESRTIPFGFTPEGLGTKQIHVIWRAERINGVSIEGNEEVSFEVRPPEEPTNYDLFRVNPYVTGAPVDSEQTFFGREDIIDRVVRLLRVDGPSTVVLLEGNRRAGKTSILKRLQKSQELTHWVPVYCQFQGVSGEPNAQSLYRLVARELLRSVAGTSCGSVPEELREIVQESDPLKRITLCRRLAASIGEDRPFERFEELLQMALAAIRPKRMLLMLDEFEKIHQGIEQHQMSPLVPENFRYLFHTYPEVSGILSGSIRIKRLRKEYWNVLFGIGTPIVVGPLKPEAAKSLVIRPAERVLNYSDSAVERILELCAFQPFLIQSLASAIFEECASAMITSVTTELVNQSAQALVLNNEHFYTIFRQQSLTARQRFLACLIDSLGDTAAKATFDVIRDNLEAAGIQVESDVHLKGDLEDLRERELVAFIPDSPVGYYKIEVPLFSQWLRAKVDFQAERREAMQE
jgi:type I restriction enzyme M protein